MMGIEDRDWYREAARKRLDDDYRYYPKQFRASRTKGQASNIFSAVSRTVVYCLAVYGAIALVQKAHERTGTPNLTAIQITIKDLLQSR